MGTAKAGDLAERARRLCADDWPVDVAVAELLRLSGDDRFELSAAYAAAVRRDGGQVGPAAQLLELVKFEAEPRRDRAVKDPDRLPGRVLAVYVRGVAWGLHYVAMIIALLWVFVTDGGPGAARWVIGGFVLLLIVRVGLNWHSNMQGATPWDGPDRDLTGVVPQLARRVARRAVQLARDDDQPDASRRLCATAFGGSATELARRRAPHVLREAAWLLATSATTPVAARRARHLLREARATCESQERPR